MGQESAACDPGVNVLVKDPFPVGLPEMVEDAAGDSRHHSPDAAVPFQSVGGSAKARSPPQLLLLWTLFASRGVLHLNLAGAFTRHFDLEWSLASLTV